MSDIDYERDLVRCILGRKAKSDAEIDIHLDAAAAQGVDMLDYCARRLGLGETLVLERAARWAGLGYAEQPPPLASGSAFLPKLEALATIRALKTRVMGREMVFAAPTFREIVRLRGIVARQPDFPRFFCVTSARAVRAVLTEASGEALLREARERHNEVWPRANVTRSFTIPARTGMFFAFAASIGVVASAVFFDTLVISLILTVLLLASGLPKVLAAFSRRLPGRMAARLVDRDLPVYTVLLPLHREAHMVPQLALAMRALDYPPEKLDIKFVVESTSPKTLAAARAELVDPRFELVVVPDAAPLTKPKALNYALPLVRGEHVVVFDAEDVPDPQQLRLAAARFAAEPDIAVLQADLLPENGGENLIAGLFAAEYMGHFGITMRFLVKHRLPAALGGTSNHFRTEIIRSLGGWDPANVTEDADLGVKIARRGLRLVMLDSVTREEAPLSVGAWTRQRSRWSKGWMQTAISHVSDLGALYRDLGTLRATYFLLSSFSNLFASTIHTSFIALSLVLLATGQFGIFELGPALATTLLTYGSTVIGTWRGLRRQGQEELAAAQALMPAYWTLHATATIRGAAEAVLKPHYWSKTAHGLTRVPRQVRVAPQRSYRERARSEVSISGVRPEMRSARTRPEPAAMVQPNVP